MNGIILGIKDTDNSVVVDQHKFFLGFTKQVVFLGLLGRKLLIKQC